MKRICMLLIIAVLISMFWQKAFAAESTLLDLEIDNIHVYSDMESSYNEGYIPRVDNGYATIILPLVSSTSFFNGTITAVPNLGTASTSPFIIKNYKKDVKMKPNIVADGTIVNSYLVRFDLALAANRSMGTYPVSIEVQGMKLDGISFTQIFTVYVTISDGHDPNAITPTEIPSTIHIDDSNIYEGMSRAYNNGYTPVVQGGTATIILPLISDGEIHNNRITATPNLGELKNSPFEIRSYQKNVTKQANTVWSGIQVNSYLVRFDLQLDPDRVNGVYPVNIEVKAQGLSGTQIQQTFVIYVTITDGKDPNAPPAEPVEVVLDHENVYKGMEKAYSNGYAPEVKDGIVDIVVPILSKGDIRDNTLTVVPNLGDPTVSPFVYKNYQKNVSLKSNPTKSGTSMQSYLVSFVLPLSSNRVNGIYPVSVEVKGQGKDDTKIQQTFIVYVTITDGKDPNAVPEPETPSSQPKVIVSKYSINPETVTAGSVFNAKIVLKNTSKIKKVQNMTVRVSCELPGFSLQNDSNTFYYNEMGIGSTIDLELKYKVGLETPAQSYNIVLTMEYDDDETKPLTSTGMVSVEVIQPMKVELETPLFAETVNAGDTMVFSVNVMNLGRSKIYNVRCILEVPGLEPKGAAFIGNMEPGMSATGETNVFIGPKESEDYDARYGKTKGKVMLIYEDGTGKEYSTEKQIVTEVNKPVLPQEDKQKEENSKKAGQWWISILIGGIVIAGLAAYVFMKGRKRVQYEEG